MSPFSMKMFSQGQSKFLPSHTSAQLKETKEDKIVKKKWKISRRKVNFLKRNLVLIHRLCSCRTMFTFIQPRFLFLPARVLPRMCTLTLRRKFFRCPWKVQERGCLKATAGISMFKNLDLDSSLTQFSRLDLLLPWLLVPSS